MTRIALLLAVLALPACATLMAGYGSPGNGVTPEIAQQWGCDYDAIMTAAANKKGYRYVPRPEDTACDLLEVIGAPYRYELMTTRNIRAVNWWYRAGGGMQLVTLHYGKDWRGNPAWVVEYVGW